jgi:hypothetical protein
MSTFNFPSHIKEEISISLAKNVEDVFNFIAVNFLENYPKWSPEVASVEGLSEQEFGINYQFKQVRMDKKVRTESVLTVTDFEPYQQFGYTNFKDHYHCHYLFEQAQQSLTNLTFSFDLENIDMMMRPFGKLIRSAIREGLQQTATNINQLLIH